MGLGIDRLLRGGLTSTMALGVACAASSSRAPQSPARPEPPIDPDVAECTSYQAALQRALSALDEDEIDVRKAFGTIDRPVEAVWILDNEGHHPIEHACLTKVVNKTAGGYSVAAACLVPSGPRCDDGRYVMSTCIFIVRPDGSFDSVSVTHPDLADACRPDDGATEGRRPAGFLGNVLSGQRRTLGQHFARAARDEAASIVAFSQLANELARVGAPPSLVRDAHHAAREEHRHAGAMSRLARRFGAAPEPAIVRAHSPRPLLAIALDNAVEGCVNETYAALRMTHQAAHAADAEIRATTRQIARDELGHAAWSWRLARWAEPQLAPSERRAVEHARRDALAQLDVSFIDPTPELRQLAGVPDRSAAHSLVEELRAATLEDGA